MGDLSFANFEARSFEQFTQALSAAVLGPGVLVFGDGPDGGREASFRGRVPFPSSSDEWDGYIILQAKYRQKPRGNASDASWLADQIRKDLEGFEVGGDRPPPEFYIIATNVTLSGVAGRKGAKGGQQKIDEVLKDFAHLGIKDYRVWHPDVMEALLSSHPGLKRSYTGWLKPADVLGEALTFFTSRTPNFHAIMLLFLQRELRDQRGTRLQQAGHAGDAATNLESVFTDLPFSEQTLPSYLRVSEYAPAGQLLRELLGRTSHKLDPNTLRTSARKDMAGPRGDRYLILGGPGQGKSTITQFLAQILRLRLLTDEKAAVLNAETDPIIRTISARLEEDGYEASGARRFPIRLELPKLADAISQSAPGDTPISLIDYISRHIQHVTKQPVDPADVRSWLAMYPWALLLDGLDEVPPTGSRNEVIRCIREFWDEASAANADVMMVVTTRPQGYNNELGTDYYSVLELTKLDVPTALQYAQRLAQSRLTSEDDRSRVLTKLTDATSNETTKLLLISPLQVAIMFALIDQSGNVPRDRWSLFHEYFGVVVKREQEKFGRVGSIVRDRIRPITEIVQKAGFVLHTLAERPRGADAFFTVPAFRSLVESHMAGEGRSGEDLERAVDEIAFVATNRLVFLEQRVDGEIAFDVRSLQEYTAAAYLMSGPEAHVQARLRAIANRSHWQHVFRIAASKCFAAPDAAQYRDTILTICEELENDGQLDRLTHAGGRLALELLSDGLASDLPAYQRMFARKALSVTKLGPDAVQESSVSFALKVQEADLTEYFETQLNGPALVGRLGAWKLLIELALAKVPWVEDIAVRHWPSDLDEALTVSMTPVSKAHPSWLISLIGDTLAAGGPAKVWRSRLKVDRARRRDETDQLLLAFPYLKLFSSRDFEENWEETRATINSITDVATLSVNLADKVDQLRDLLDALPNTKPWQIFKIVGRFVEKPNKDQLTEALRAFLDHEPDDVDAARGLSPWPLRSVWKLAYNGTKLSELIEDADRGRFGGADQWHAAEARFESKPLTKADFEVWTEGIFFDERVPEVGLFEPYLLSQSSREEGQQGVSVGDLIEVLNRCPPSGAKETLVWMINAISAQTSSKSVSVTTDAAIDLLLPYHLFIGRRHVDLDWLASYSDQVLADERFGAALAAATKLPIRVAGTREIAGAVAKVVAYHPSKPELLIWYLAALALAENKVVIHPGINEAAERALEHPDPSVRCAASLISALGSDTHLDQMRIAAEEADPLLLSAIIGLTRGDRIPDHVAEPLLRGAMMTKRGSSRAEEMTGNLIGVATRRRTSLLIQQSWVNLGFDRDLFEVMIGCLSGATCEVVD